MPDLAAYLARQAERPFVWGASDCGCLIADWVRLRRGVDPLARLRGAYSGALGNARLMAAEGGMLALVTRLLAEAGLPEAHAPQAGDVGLIDVPASGLTGAICLGDRWAMKTPNGVGFVYAAPLRAWSV